MYKQAIFDAIWSEKREKVNVTKGKPNPLIVSLGDFPATAHQILYGVLVTLIKNPDRGYGWSKSWGRTKVVVDPQKGLGFWHLAHDETKLMLGSSVHTKVLIDPSVLLSPDENIGLFKLQLNKESMLLEGAVLQLVRMLDELVWCRHLYLIETQSVESRFAYAMACSHVYSFGVEISYVSEDDIMSLRARNPLTPVRLYGNTKKSFVVPLVIGAVVGHDRGNLSDDMTLSPALYDREKWKILKRNDDMRHRIVMKKSLTIDVNEELLPPPVMCGITLAKKLHAGHLFLLANADLVRTTVRSPYELFLESNDTGNRIKQMVVRLAALLGSSIPNTVVLLQSGVVSKELIGIAYRTRETLSEGGDSLGKFFLERAPLGLLTVMSDSTARELTECGFNNVRIFADSIVASADSRCALPQSAAWLGENGFSFASIENERGNAKLIVTQKNGEFTATGTRALAVQHVGVLCGSNRVLYVDAGLSVRDAGVVLGAMNTQLETIEGATLGIGLEIASGTNGKAVDMSTLLKNSETLLSNCGLDLSSAAKYFLLSRHATSTAIRIGDNVGCAQRGLLYYDYRSLKHFHGDFSMSILEAASFRDEANELSAALASGGGAANHHIEIPLVVANLLSKFQTIESTSALGILFPKCKPARIDPQFRIVKDAVVRLLKCSVDEAWQVIFDAYLSGGHTPALVHSILKSRGITLPSKEWTNNRNPTQLIFVDSLLKRGYDKSEIVVIAPRYVYGDLCLLKKRCAYFDWLSFVLEEKEILMNARGEVRVVLSRAIRTALERIGFGKDEK